MDVNVQKQTYIPDSNENVLFEALKGTRVSFVVLLIVVVGIYIGIFFLLDGNNNSNTTSSNVFILLLEVILWVMLIFIIYVNIQNYDTKNYDFRSKMENLFNTKLAELEVHAKSNTKHGNKKKDEDQDENKDKCENEEGEKEVFHIPDNIHTYQEAKDLCEVYDARLASYDEIEKAYNKGATWCSYGWSKEQMALFPTQKSVYNELKKLPNHKHDCGRPGINGGYFKNPNVRFGVNCYGKKPEATENDKSYMHALNHTPVVMDKLRGGTDSDKAVHKKIIAPFNKDKWTMYN
jgi:hypothetical protein